MAELELIEAIKAALGPRPARLLTGPGDDASVVRADAVLVTSIDTVVDGVHFSLATHSPADVGHKALATALSDIAAMGAGPGEAYAALVMPPDFDRRHRARRRDARAGGAARHRARGGDVVAGPVLTITITVTGWSGAADRLAYRHGARPGDMLGVTGELGGSGAGLKLIEAGETEPADLVRRHRRPEPLLATGIALAAAGVTAMIDVSDGLATDAGHLARESGVSIEVRLAELPVAEGVESAEFAATAGDDYELLFTVPPDRRAGVEHAAAATGTRVSWLGDVRAGGGLVEIRARDGAVVDLRGYEHL